MSIQFQPTALVGAIALALGFSSSSYATESKIATANFDTLVITATRAEEKIENIPARISIIEPHVLEQSGISALPDLLKTEPSLNVVQSGGYGQQTSIFLRGTESDHTLVLRDGIRLNTATTSAAAIPFLDTTDLKQIEILKGPASVLYGTDAIGGVVQFVSKTPEKTGAFVTGEVGENNTYKAIVGADLAENGIYAQVRSQRLESDGTPIYNINDAHHYSYDQKGYSAKFGVEQNTYAASIDYSQNEGNSEYSNYGTLSSQDFKNEVINLKGRLHATDQVQINARLSQFKDDLNQVNSTGFIHSTTQEAELYSTIHFADAQNILVGVTHRNTDASTSAMNENVDSTGYYIQHQYQTERLNSQIGLRVEDNEKFGSHTVAQGGLRYKVLPNTSVYTNIGSAFKAPSLNDMYATWGGNPDLAPEESISYEIGIDQQLPFNTLVGASVFYTDIDHLITSQCVTSNCPSWDAADWKNVNTEKALMKGAELTAKWSYQDYFIHAGYSYVKTEDKKYNTELLRRPRQALNISAGLANADYGLSAALVAKSEAKDYNQDIPGYARIDLNAYWKINPSVKVFTNIENVGDVKYKTVHSINDQYYVNGGRLASAGVTFTY